MKMTFKPLRLLGARAFFLLSYLQHPKCAYIGRGREVRGACYSSSYSLSSPEVFVLRSRALPLSYLPSLSSPLPVPKGKRRKDHRSPGVGCSKSWISASSNVCDIGLDGGSEEKSEGGIVWTNGGRAKASIYVDPRRVSIAQTL